MPRLSAPAAARACAAARDELRCLLSSVADARHRVVLTVVTGGMASFAENLVASLAAVGAAPHLLAVALDGAAAARMRARGVAVFLAGAGGGVGGGSAPETWGSPAYAVTTMQKTEAVEAVVVRGFHVLFTDADTVWLRNVLDEGDGGAPVGGEGEGAAEALAAAAAASRPPAPSGGVFAHACGALRLGDTVSPLGDGVPAAATARADCGPAGLFAYDLLGTYGDTGGVDTAFFYLRSTARARAHMRRAVALQGTPEGAALPSDQEVMNALLQPWLPGHAEAAPASEAAGGAPARLWPWLRARGAGVHAGAPPLPYAAADLPAAADSSAGFGPDRLRVALLDPLRVPSGCRLAHARAARADVLVAHANCVTGGPGGLHKLVFLARWGLWRVRLWRDEHVRALAALLALALAAREAGVRTRRCGGGPASAQRLPGGAALRAATDSRTS